MWLPIENRHEVLALCAFIFFDLNAEIVAVFRDAIEPIKQHSLIFSAGDRVWINLRIAAQQIKCCLIEAKSFGAIPLVLVHKMRPKYSKEYLLAVKVLRLDVPLALRRVCDYVIFPTSVLQCFVI